MHHRVVVVGAGVIGLTTALHLVERFPGAFDVTIVSDKFSPDITSDKAGMLFLPVDFRTQEEKSRSPYNQEVEVQRWSRQTFQKLHSIYKSEENAEMGICLEHGYFLLESPTPDPWYKDDVFGFRHVAVDSVEASLIHVPPNCVDVWAFGTYALEMTTYLRWLTYQVKKGGVKFEQRKISSFEELSSPDVIINCTGLGSCDLLKDRSMHPVRGQTVLAKAPWLKHWVVAYGKHQLDYIIPREKNVVLGGTVEVGKWSETPDPHTTDSILQRCQQYIPSLSRAEVIGGWAGLRPLRDPIRLDSCEGPGGSLLVHCYGHGGQGIVLSWGCALDIGNIVQQKLQLKSSL